MSRNFFFFIICKLTEKLRFSSYFAAYSQVKSDNLQEFSSTYFLIEPPAKCVLYIAHIIYTIGWGFDQKILEALFRIPIPYPDFCPYGI